VPYPRAARCRHFGVAFLLATATGGPLLAAEPPGVTVAIVRALPLADRLEALGTLRANEAATIAAKVTATVQALHFDDGQRVAAGALLVELDHAEERARLTEAEARVAEAERQFERARTLAATGVTTAALLDERQRDLELARALRLASAARLADHLIRAPFAGVLGLRQISRGTLVTPGTPLVTLDDDRVMKLDFAVPSRYLAALRPGLALTARAAAFGARVFPGQISAIDSRVDATTRAVTVRALLDNPDFLLRPGLSLQVEVSFNPREAPTLPEAAVLHQGDVHFVLRIVGPGDAPRVERQQVEIGARLPGTVEIRAGLAPGERVVTHGQERLRPGQSVRILAATGPGEIEPDQENTLAPFDSRPVN